MTARAFVAGSEHEDCEQEVFVRIWGKAALYDPERGSAAAWLLTLARRTALNVHARQRPHLPLADEPDRAVERDEIDAFWLDAAMARLSDRERLVLERRLMPPQLTLRLVRSARKRDPGVEVAGLQSR